MECTTSTKSLAKMVPLLETKNRHSTQEDFCDAVQLTIWDIIENEHNDIPNTNTGNKLPNNT